MSVIISSIRPAKPWGCSTVSGGFLLTFHSRASTCWCITLSVQRLALPISCTGISIGLPTHSGMKKSLMPKTHRSRCLFLVVKTSLLTPTFVNVSPVPACRDLTACLHSVLSNTLNLTVSRRAYFIPPDTPMVKRFSTALMSLIGLWTGLRTTSKRSSPHPYKYGLFALHSPVQLSSRCFLIPLFSVAPGNAA